MSGKREASLKFPILRGHWDDPDLADRFRAFVLETYRLQLAIERESPAEEVTPALKEKVFEFHLGLDNLPEEHLPPEQFMYLTKVRQDIYRWLNAPKAETDDPRVAGVVLVRGYILRVALFFVEHLLTYLMFESRFHPECEIQVNAIGAFSYETTEQGWREWLNTMTTFAAGCNLLFQGQPLNANFASEVHLLHVVGDVFFDTLQSVFPVRAVGKCRMAFTLLMKDLGTDRACSQIENYIRRRKAMYREMVAYERNGGLRCCDSANLALAAQTARVQEMSAKLEELTTKIEAQNVEIAENTKKVANMDRRQRTLLAFVKTTVSGFVRLFRPGSSSPSRENVGEALLPSDRFACLRNVKEPHASQLRAVIQKTKEHPIVRCEGEKCVFTLASAARAVWDRDHKKWELDPGSFETYEALKSACYNLAKDPKTDPFHYAE